MYPDVKCFGPQDADDAGNEEQRNNTDNVNRPSNPFAPRARLLLVGACGRDSADAVATGWRIS